jgi:hypothetical protein
MNARGPKNYYLLLAITFVAIVGFAVLLAVDRPLGG